MSNSIIKRNTEETKLENMDEGRRNQIMNIKDSIQFDYESSLNYANEATKHLSDFSSGMLSSLRLKDSPEIEDLMNELMSELNKVDGTSLIESKPNFLKRLFKTNELQQFFMKYEDVSSVIAAVKDKLGDAMEELTKDINVCEEYMGRNIEYINDLDNYILAGNLRIEEEKKNIEEERKTIDSNDMMAVNILAGKESEINRLERKIHDLVLMREIAVQNLPQIRMIQEGDGVLVEKIQSSINSAIPLWESQMLVSVQLLRQKGALAIQKGVTDTTNNLIARNGELLKSGSIEIAKQLERGVVDVDVLKKNSENLIATLKGIKEVRQQGSEARLKATQELNQLHDKMNKQLLLETTGVTSEKPKLSSKY